MGKAYTNRKPKDERPESDYYTTPYSLTWELEKLNILDKNKITYEPACGKARAISSQLLKKGFTNLIEDDINVTGKDFLKCNNYYPQIISNPPFSIFDEFVNSARRCSDKWVFIIKTNFFGAYQRYHNGIWKNLKEVHIFNRQVDYRSPLHEDGFFFCGNLITAWAIWDKTWNENYWKTNMIDVQNYAKLSVPKEFKPKKQESNEWKVEQ